MKTKADLEKLARELTLSLDLSEWNYGEGGKGSRAWKVPQGWATEEILAALTATHNDALEGAADGVVAACQACDGKGGVVVGVHCVTQEMAMDAGMPEMAGSDYQEEVQQCEYCGRPADAIRAMKVEP